MTDTKPPAPKAADTPTKPPPAEPPPADSNSTYDRIIGAVDPEADPVTRVTQLYGAVTSELSAGATSVDALNELKAALQFRASVVSRYTEEAIDELMQEITGTAAAEAASKRAAKSAYDPPPKLEAKKK